MQQLNFLQRNDVHQGRWSIPAVGWHRIGHRQAAETGQSEGCAAHHGHLRPVRRECRSNEVRAVTSDPAAHPAPPVPSYISQTRPKCKMARSRKVANAHASVTGREKRETPSSVGDVYFENEQLRQRNAVRPRHRVFHIILGYVYEAD